MNQRIECFGASRPQDGRSINEDAFFISHGENPCAVLCDGAGNAQLAAKKVVSLFTRFFNQSTSEQIAQTATWNNWVKLLDSSMLGGNQSTFLAVAFLDGKIIGACAGDSRAYLIDRDGNCRILTEEASKYRLGSGNARAFPINLPLGTSETLLLLSDGAWTPLGLYILKKTVLAARIGRSFSDLPQAVLDAAGKCGRADDMTAIAVRAI